MEWWGAWLSDPLRNEAADRLSRNRLERLEILDQIALFLFREIQSFGGIVMVDDGIEVGEPAVVIEAALRAE